MTTFTTLVGPSQALAPGGGPTGLVGGVDRTAPVGSDFVVLKRPAAVLDLGSLDLDDTAQALADQNDYDHRWLVDPRTGRVEFWSRDSGIDGETPVEIDELDLVPIDPLPSHEWYRDMADFAAAISDDRAGRRLGRAIRGAGAFRRFKDELYEEHPELLPAWYEFRDVRARRRAVEWLMDRSLVDGEAARRYLAEHPDPDLP